MMRLRASSAETSGLPVSKPRMVCAISSSSSKTSPDGPSSTISLWLRPRRWTFSSCRGSAVRSMTPDHQARIDPSLPVTSTTW